MPIAASLGTGRAVASSCMALSSLGLAVSSPLVGRLMDRYGALRVIRVSIVLFVLCLLSLSIGPIVPQALAAKIFLLGLLGVGTSPVGYLPVLAHSFERRLGLAFGVASIGAGVGAAVAPVMAGRAIKAYGWQSAYLILAVVAALLGWVAFELLRRSGLGIERRKIERAALSDRIAPNVRRDAHGRQALLSLRFWLIGVSIALVAAVGLGSMVHIPALLIDKGMSAQAAAAGSAFAAIGLTIGRFAAGMLLDYLPARILSACIFALGACGAWILAFASHGSPLPLLALGAALTGALIGAEGDLVPFLVKRYFGIESFGLVYGFMISVFCLGTLGGPIVYGMAFDKFHSYRAVMSVAGGACLLGALGILLIGPYRYPARSLPEAGMGSTDGT
ncbi:MFS transporter [Paraburkholderia sp. J63]|uniref:MFS transporter n=1 Tax=Paraburkholderia sp. J63 TaxID=2805434 RepID=UPI002ABDE8F0|nr:MFS transporter [Paraburkholderia sp. J63]